MKAVKTIRDPIHGTIELTELEIALIDTPEMQRLRNIKQNGFCYLVYPAMNSTRFEHSLGVMHVAGRLANKLELDEDDKNLLRVSGLLHDIGHCAFSHTSDKILEKFNITHEENSIRIIQNSQISDILSSYGISPKEVSRLIVGDGKYGKIISSEIDVDKMDYLIRDSYYAGVAYGIIDLERILYGIKLVKENLVVDVRSLEAVESLLISRNLMYQTVYRHHTKRIVERMFSEALKKFIELENLSCDEFIKMDDIDLISRMRNSEGYVRDMVDRIDKRRLFKKVFHEKLIMIEDAFRKELAENFEEIQREIAQDFGIKEGYLLIDIPEMKLSEFEILIDEGNGVLRRIDEVSNLAKSLEKSELEKLTFCIYAAKEELHKLKNFTPEDYFELKQPKLSKFMK